MAARHGTTYMYNSKGCRCEPCCTVRNAYMRDYRARKKAEREELGLSRTHPPVIPLPDVHRPPFESYDIPCTYVADFNIFHPDNEHDQEEAKSVCLGRLGWQCPLLQECFDYAMEAGEDGVYGGTSFDERLEVYRERRQTDA